MLGTDIIGQYGKFSHENIGNCYEREYFGIWKLACKHNEINDPVYVLEVPFAISLLYSSIRFSTIWPD